jgi:putative hydrolase of the HAD superfamily
MNNYQNIKAILFDSGRVLNGPKTGHWFISPNFFKYVDENKFNSTWEFRKQYAFKKAMNYINKQTLISTEEEEFNHFLQFYTIFSKKLRNLKLKDSDIEGLTKDLVYNCEKYVFYEDVFEVIPKLSENYKLAVISDAWPSLDSVYKHADLKKYFSSFVISSIKGITKPDELMYKTALDELKVKPEEAIFVDDSVKNCDGANKLGIRPILLIRDKNLKVNTPYMRISNLNELSNMI